jgi:hypothetical protein
MARLKRRTLLWIGATAVALVLVVAVVVVVQQVAGRAHRSSNRSESRQSAAASPTVTPSSVPGCPAATVTVKNSAELTTALADPKPGTVILLADGVYTGQFTAHGSGTADKPITLCGSQAGVLDGGDVRHGYVLHLDGVAHWVVRGFTIRNGQKGVMADRMAHSVIQDLTVQHIGDEAIHLRAFSTDNRVAGNRVADTGLRRPKYGEGIYVGSAKSNWCNVTKCEPDRSDRNVISGNDISHTTAESVDIKEGTSDGSLTDNTFDGSSMNADYADSWVDVKGNGWTVAGNTGNNSSQDGFQTHQILDGWGVRNAFSNNRANVNGPGYGYALTPAADNVVDCSNLASHAAKGLSNVACASKGATQGRQ